ncbi:MAG TPA: tRNA pseudouridine(38-40) synthase TruA [Terracidiphilus sp.]|nr:tRNA pseudouridine(38-40) synthase TruA [Terracidiphilus sp.]
MEDLEPVAGTQNWKVTLAYDGSDYSGWQVQPGEPTIQAELQAALGRICGETPLPQGSGRTDAGVHALAQVASFALQAPIPAENLHRALNKTLPSAIRVMEVRRVAAEFHARHSAVAKTYEYRIFRGRICPPTLARFVHTCTWKLNQDMLDEAAAAVVGEHDFTSLAATDADAAQRQEEGMEPRTAIRTIFSSQWEASTGEAGNLLTYRVRGNGFLHHMVRNLVGTMLEIGRGQFPAGSMKTILETRSRSAAGPTAPARGLFLHSVEYDGADAEITVRAGE